MILSLAEKHTVLRKQGAHFVGKCPVCGGSDDTNRFVVNIVRDFCQCYSCGFNADPVRFLRQIEGKTCPDAHRTLGITCDRPECPVWDGCSRGRGKHGAEQPAKPAMLPVSGPVIHQAETPAAAWQQKAAEMVQVAHQTLLETPEQLAYLAGRGLPLEAVKKYKLGYIPKDLYRERAAWGLPVELKDDGKAKKLWIPQGILIPRMEPDGSGAIHRIRIRKQTLLREKDARYHWLPGSGNDILCLNTSAKAHVIVESDLDGLLIDWAAGDLVGTIPLGSCSTRPKSTAFELLQKSLSILVALDFDTPKWNEQKQRLIAPGADACGWWARTFPDTWKRWPVPAGKDPGEAFKEGVDIRGWVMSGLPPALQVQISAVARCSNISSQAPNNNDKCSAPDVTITVAQVAGHEIHITDHQPTWLNLMAQGKTAYSTNELKRMAAFVKCADPSEQGHVVDVITAAKEIFSGYIQKTEAPQ